MNMSNMIRVLALFVLCISSTAAAVDIQKLSPEAVEQAEFFIFDVTDDRSTAVRGVDAYILNDKAFIALSPMFEGLRVNYSLNEQQLMVNFADQQTIFTFSQNPSATGEWFFDGYYYFLNVELLESVFASVSKVDLNNLTIDFSGHSIDFPYKVIKNQTRQRKIRSFVKDEQEQEEGQTRNVKITIPDEYRAFTVPSGVASFDLRANQSETTYTGIVQTVSDLAYHSADITIATDKDNTDSRLTLSRYPSRPNERLFGLFDYYNFGDIWLRDQSSLSNGSQGLGINFGFNQSESVHQNMTTSFTKVARPGWEVDVFHNGVYLETRTVPDNGLLVFESVDVHYGANEFKLQLFGPYGEEETLLHFVRVDKNPLSKGDYSLGFSILEYDNSLLDMDFDTLDIDTITVNGRYGVFDNWMVGSNVSFNKNRVTGDIDITTNLSNRVTIPNWLLEHNLAYAENRIRQQASVATQSIFSDFDNFSLFYESTSLKKDGEFSEDSSLLRASYNIKHGSFQHSLNYSYDKESPEVDPSTTAGYRLSYLNRYFSLSNNLSYRSFSGQDEITTGSISIASRIFSKFRILATVPYQFGGDEGFEFQNISLSGNYLFTDDWENRHVVSLSATQRDKISNLFTLGYNFSLSRPTHQLVFSSRYDTDDRWSLAAGVVFNFGYDYFNNEFLLTSQGSGKLGSLDVHTYLDRRLNGVPDVLDHNLEGVTFSGRPGWDLIKTNKQGEAKLFGAPDGIFSLQANWQSGTNTINNDYLIFSHPGAVQRVNLPFYLTTEIELFVLLNENNTLVNLQGMTVVAENTITKTIYEVDSDSDGYVNFTDLLPGKYKVFVKPESLNERKLSVELKSINFETPARGGFVVLPNMLLSRDGNEKEPVELDVEITEDNYIPFIDTENEKLMHLAPEVNFLAPYSLDDLDDISFKKLDYEVKIEQRKQLQQALSQAQLSAHHLRYGLDKTAKNEAEEAGVSHVLYIGEYPSMKLAMVNSNQAAGELEIVEGLSSTGSKIFRIKAGEFATEDEAIQFATEHYGNEVFKIYQGRLVSDLESASNLNELDSTAIAQPLEQDINFSDETNAVVEPEEIKEEVVEEASTLDFLSEQVTNGFVIQYTAAKNIASLEVQAQKLQGVEAKVAQKSVGSAQWFCLISSPFDSRAEASNALAASGVSGFIVSASVYQQVNESGQ